MMHYLYNLCMMTSLLLFTNCSKENDKPLRIETNITVDGRSRHYILYLPAGYYEDSAAYPLVIGMHGGGGSAAQFDKHYGLTQKAAAAKVIVVYPEGVRSDGRLGVRTWNAGTCCDYAAEHNIDDVKFISNLIDLLVKKYHINPKKVYATGMSNGGMMAYRLACEIPQKIAAIAAVSCTMVYDQPFTPSRPVPILHIQSAIDQKVPPAGGTGIFDIPFPPVRQGLDTWAAVNSCGAPVVIKDNPGYTLTKWMNCNGGVTMEYYLTVDGGHAWPGAVAGTPWGDKPSTMLNANDVLLDFFTRWQLP